MLKRTAVPFYSKKEARIEAYAGLMGRVGRHNDARRAFINARRARDARVADHARRMACAGKLMHGRPMPAPGSSRYG